MALSGIGKDFNRFRVPVSKLCLALCPPPPGLHCCHCHSIIEESLYWLNNNLIVALPLLAQFRMSVSLLCVSLC